MNNCPECKNEEEILNEIDEREEEKK